jgi:hypothetical protein
VSVLLPFLLLLLSDPVANVALLWRHCLQLTLPTFMIIVLCSAARRQRRGRLRLIMDKRTTVTVLLENMSLDGWTVACNL